MSHLCEPRSDKASAATQKIEFTRSEKPSEELEQTAISLGAHTSGRRDVANPTGIRTLHHPVKRATMLLTELTRLADLTFKLLRLKTYVQYFL